MTLFASPSDAAADCAEGPATPGASAPIDRGMASGTPPAPLVVTTGDPAGIGPEMAALAWEARAGTSGVSGGSADAPAPLPTFFVIGDDAAIRSVWDGPIERIDGPDDAADVFARALPVLALAPPVPPPGMDVVVTPGAPSDHGAAMALHALEAGIGLARTGAASALVTGPVSKHGLHRVGFTHPGQTEFIAERAGVSASCVAMLLAAGPLRVAPLTIHLPLAAVPAALTEALIVQRARIIARSLARDFGVAAPRLALAGLNPHAGEGGDLGTEEATVMEPALATLRAEGIAIDGPMAADTLFAPHVRTRYDAILCAYHDQALAPFKALAFEDGVNMTAGLPFVRTSADHGTAFALAGTRTADPRPTIAAIRLAASAAACRRVG